MVGGLAAAPPVDYSHSPTVEPADSSRRIREPPDDAWEQWRSLVFRRLGPVIAAVIPHQIMNFTKCQQFIGPSCILAE